VTLDYLVILLLLGLGIIALGYILEARSREAGVDLDGIRLRPWAADKYAGREALRAAGLLLHDHRGIVDPRNMPDGWPDHFPASPGEYRMAVEAGWHDPDKGGPS